MNREQALKPCPFCGSANLKSGGDDKHVGYWCSECGAAGPNHYDSRYDWNTRAALSAPKAEPETLPCDVQLPGVLLRKGISMDTLMFALKRREGRPEEDTRFRTSPVPALTDETVERAAKEMAFAARMEHDTSEDAEEFWSHTAWGNRTRYRCMARAALLAAFPSKGEGE